MRCFIALELSEPVINVLSDVTKKIQKQKLIEAKFVEEYNTHLTLKFLGEIDEKTLGLVHQKLETIKLPDFKVATGNLGMFTHELPRILWVSLRGPGIFTLVTAIEQVLGDIIPREKRSFVAHVTLARIKRVLHEKFYEFIERSEIKPVEFMVESFTLKQSQLTTDGPIYTDVACYPLTRLEK